MYALINLVLMVIEIYMWMIIIHVVMTLLAQFNVINSRSPVVYTIGNFLYKITEPFLRPIRQFVNRVLPDLGGIDISPMIGILLLIFAQNLIIHTIAPALL